MVTVHIFSELKTSWKSNVFTNKVDNNYWQIKRVAIRVMKFEAVRLHFLGDIFDAVANFVASAPHYHRCRHCKTWKNSFIDPPPPLHPIFFCLAPLWSHTCTFCIFGHPQNPPAPPPPPTPTWKKMNGPLLLYCCFSSFLFIVTELEGN